MIGLGGNDSYVVNNAADIVIEADGEGTDLITSSINFNLQTHNTDTARAVENLTLTGGTDTVATGNALDNTITGDGGNNTIDGGLGIDRMVGGAGNDSYTVDNTSDVIVEAGAAGTDDVTSSVSYTLSAEVENLVLTGATNINGTGNDFGNSITGNTGNNVLTGGLGTNVLIGGNGDDTVSYAWAGEAVTVTLGTDAAATPSAPTSVTR